MPGLRCLDVAGHMAGQSEERAGQGVEIWESSAQPQGNLEKQPEAGLLGQGEMGTWGGPKPRRSIRREEKKDSTRRRGCQGQRGRRRAKRAWVTEAKGGEAPGQAQAQGHTWQQGGQRRGVNSVHVSA